jgi:hypothetical protein
MSVVPPKPGRVIFDPKTVAAIVAAGIVAFGLFLVMLAYSGGLGAGRDGRAHALSVSAVGFQGLVRLIGLGGGEAVMVRDPVELDAEELVVVAIDERTTRAALASLLAERGGRPTLLVLPKWRIVGDEEHPGWVRSAGPQTATDGEELLRDLGAPKLGQRNEAASSAVGADILAGWRRPAPKLIQTISGGGFTPLVTAAGGTLLARWGEAPLYVLADPDLLNNQGIKEPANARAALALLEALSPEGATHVAFDLTLSGFGRSPSALKLAFEPPFLPLTLALALAAILAGLHGAFRFGPEAKEDRAIAFGKSALVENSAALFKIAKREHRTGGAYAELIREAAAHGSGAHLALRDAELDAYLDRVSPPNGPSFSELGERARGAASRYDLVAAARALFQWKKDLIK